MFSFAGRQIILGKSLCFGQCGLSLHVSCDVRLCSADSGSLPQGALCSAKEFRYLVCACPINIHMTSRIQSFLNRILHLNAMDANLSVVLSLNSEQPNAAVCLFSKAILFPFDFKIVYQKWWETELEVQISGKAWTLMCFPGDQHTQVCHMCKNIMNIMKCKAVTFVTQTALRLTGWKLC